MCGNNVCNINEVIVMCNNNIIINNISNDIINV